MTAAAAPLPAIAPREDANVGLTEWLDAAVSSLAECAVSLLGTDRCEEASPRGSLSLAGWGSYVPLATPDAMLQVGVVASEPDCIGMASTMLGLGPEELAAADVGDAMGEIANVLAGAVKTVLAGRVNAIELGLPLFAQGEVVPPRAAELSATDVAVGQWRVTVVVVRGARRRRGGPS